MLSRRTEELLCRCARHRRAVAAARKSAGSLPLLLIFCRRRPSRPSSGSPCLARPWRHGGVQRWRRARPRPACAPCVGASAPAVAPCAPATAPASLPSRRPPIAAAESRRRAPPPYLAPTSIAATARTGRLRAAAGSRRGRSERAAPGAAPHQLPAAGINRQPRPSSRPSWSMHALAVWRGDGGPPRMEGGRKNLKEYAK
jgi:hypothetical protein